MRKTPLSMAAMIAALYGLAVPALAADPPEGAPKVGCFGMAFEDKAGDSGAGDKESDVIGGWYDSADGKVTVNLQLSSVSESYTGGALDTGINYYWLMNVGGATRYVGAQVDFLLGTSFDYGTYDGTQYSGEGETTGKFFEGDNGVIQIVIPKEIAKDGAELGKTQGSSAGATSIAGTGLVSTYDETSSAAEAFTVGAPCPGAAAGGGALPITVTAALGSAKKASKSKKAFVGISSSEPVSNLKATLKKGSSTIGTAKLASLNGQGTLKLKLKKKVKKGAYTLEIKGTGPSGPATMTAPVTFS